MYVLEWDNGHMIFDILFFFFSFFLSFSFSCCCADFYATRQPWHIEAAAIVMYIYDVPWVEYKVASRKHAYIILTPLNPTFI